MNMAHDKQKKETVLVGMSGGIDSSAVCMLLQEQGYQVIGLTMRMWDIPSQFSMPGQLEPNHVLEARELASKLGFPHHTLDIREDFRKVVVSNFAEEYLTGRTPNPCVLCNLHFKWKYLLREADRLGCEFVATGHYAQIVFENDRYYLEQGIDPLKDQSYFLWRLGQAELSRTLFPLGGITKATIKDYVLKRGFKEKVEKKESMEVCFIENDYRTFLKDFVPDLEERIKPGHFVDRLGRKIGQHKGFPFYTIGQRKGLDIALGYPAYIVRINAEKNTIRLGHKEELSAGEMLIEDVESPDLTGLLHSTDLKVRIRYRSEALSATVYRAGETHLIVSFVDEASAITPGQSAVFYKDGRVMGGGIISVQQNLKKYKVAITQVNDGY